MPESLTGAVRLPDGTSVRGRGRRETLPAGPLPEFGLCLGRPPSATSRGIRRRRPDWPADWIDWPDFRVPREGERAAASIVRAYLLARSGLRVEITCGGGTGRTGTVIACMSVLAGHPAEDAVRWARQHYRHRAVETPGQRRWVGWFATRHRSDGWS